MTSSQDILDHISEYAQEMGLEITTIKEEGHDNIIKIGKKSHEIFLTNRILKTLYKQKYVRTRRYRLVLRLRHHGLLGKKLYDTPYMCDYTLIKNEVEEALLIILKYQ